RDQPAAGIVRHPFRRPLQRGRQQGLLHRVLALIEGPVAAHDRREDLRRQLAQQLLDGATHISLPPSFMTGRTSIMWNAASGIIGANSIGRPRLAQSMMEKPARNSFASTYGPSVTATWPSRTRTTALWLGSARASPRTSSPDWVVSLISWSWP